MTKFRITLILGLACSFLLPVAAGADQCNSDAQNTNYHSISPNKYLFAFDVTASSCDRYGCNGYVNFAIRYHYQGGGQSITDRTLVRYHIEPGNSHTHVTLEHFVGGAYVGGAQTVVDDVAVEQVSCSAP